MRGPGQRASLHAGVGLVSAAAVALSVVLTRVYSAVLGYHFAFLAVSLALFGVGVGGVLVTLFPRPFRRPHLFSRLAVLAGLCVIVTTLALIRSLELKLPEELTVRAFASLGGVYLTCALPFVLTGMVLSIALSAGKSYCSRLYLADLVGAAFGAVLALWLLRLGAPRAGLAVGVLFGLSSVCFALGSLEREGVFSREEEAGGGWVSAAMLASSLSLLAGDYGEQWLTVKQIRFVNLERAHFSKWNELGLVTVDKPSKGMAWLRVDASAATAILDGKTEPAKHPDAMGYVLSGKEGPTLVIGAGGGREVRAALAAGQTEVHAVEINRAIVHDVMLGKLKEFSAGLYARPEVKVVVADGRSFVRATEQRYRSIVLSLVDTWAASGAGALSLTENALYTEEAVADYLRALDERGVLIMNRWDPELPRLIALAAAGLLRSGAQDPSRHMFACGANETTALLVSRAELGPDELDRLRRHCLKYRFRERFAPDRQEDETLLALAQRPHATSRALHGPDVSPPTDDRPFFFYTVAPRDLWATLKSRALLEKEQPGLLAVVMLLLVSGGCALLSFLMVLAFGERSVAGPRVLRARVLAYFAALGVGFVGVEIALVQLLASFLGHPLYALTVALGCLLLSAGVGSYLVRGAALDAVRGLSVRRAVSVSVLLVALAFALPPVLAGAVGLPFALKLVVSALVLAPVGLLAGGLLPLGIDVAARLSPRVVTGGLGLNGFMGVLSTGVALLCAMNLGYSALLLIAGVAYFLSALAIPAAPAGSAEPADADGAAEPNPEPVIASG